MISSLNFNNTNKAISSNDSFNSGKNGGITHVKARDRDNYEINT